MGVMKGLFGVGVMTVLLSGCQGPGVESSVPFEDESPEALVELGQYLVLTSACHDCHTPKVFDGPTLELDEDRWLAGHPEEAGVQDFLPAGLGSEPGGWGVVVNNHLTAWGGPWGISFAPNLTPDPETGIGSWTDEMFVNSLRNGKHQGQGRNILPPMPWMFYGQKSERELRAMFAYLMSLPPIRNAVPEPVAREDIRP